MGQMTVYDSLYSSNMQAPQKSTIARYLDKLTGHGRELQERASDRFGLGHVNHTVDTVRQYGESGVTGALLGAAHAELKTGLDIKGVPVDLGVALAAAVGGVVMVGQPAATDLKNIGASALTVFGFRKTYDFLAEQKMKAGGTPGGQFGPAQKSAIHGESFGDEEDGEDPIVAMARQL
jgi:hypothetical protein